MDPYCYGDSDVLKNKLNIRDHADLVKVEARITSLRIMETMKNPVKGSFDLKHLMNIHKQIFGDLYPFAGKLRTVNISKGFFRFADVIHIEGASNDLFNHLKKENLLKQMPMQKFCDRLAYYAAEINVLHPFREGNGRATREFIRQLAQHNGYELQYSKMDSGLLKEAFIKSTFDHKELAAIFEKHLMDQLKQRIIQHGLSGRCMKNDFLKDYDLVERSFDKKFTPADMRTLHEKVGKLVESPTPLHHALDRITQTMALEHETRHQSMDKTNESHYELEGE